MKSEKPRWFLAGLVLLSLVNITRFFWSPLDEDRPIDFQPPFVGQRLVLSGSDPYDDEKLKAEWQEISRREGFKTGSVPGLPTTPLLYPPWGLTIFSTLDPLGYRIAFRLWYLLLIIFLCIGVYFCARLGSELGTNVAFWELLLVALAFKGTVQSMTVGQPMFLCLAFGFASLYYQRTRPILGGVLLGLTIFKFSLAIPFVLLALIRRRWRVLGIAAGVVACLSLPYFLLVHDPLSSLQNYLEVASAARMRIFDSSRPIYPFSYKMVTMTEIGTLLEYLIPGSNQGLGILYPVIVVGSLLFYLLSGIARRANDHYLFLLLAIVTLLTTHHLYYDALVLLPFYLFACRLDKRARYWALLVTVPLFVPINGILNRFPELLISGLLYFTMPISMLGVALVLLLCRRNRVDG